MDKEHEPKNVLTDLFVMVRIYVVIITFDIFRSDANEDERIATNLSVTDSENKYTF